MDLPALTVDEVAILGRAGHRDRRNSIVEIAVRVPGYRLLHRLPQLAPTLAERLVDRFGTLPEIMAASTSDLESVDGIGSATARLIRDGPGPSMVEASIFERYE